MQLPIAPPFPVMQGSISRQIPNGEGWQYEPKWDGFRCLAFRDGKQVWLQSRSGNNLNRYFPELISGILAIRAKQFVLDGEIVMPHEGELSFDRLLLRLNRSADRVGSLAKSCPAAYMAFDLLVTEKGNSLTKEPLRDRRVALQHFAERFLDPKGCFLLSPATESSEAAGRWFNLAGQGNGIEGVMAKRLDTPYTSSSRGAMVKIKKTQTADCVIGGIQPVGKDSGRLLLGLYRGDGRLDYVGSTQPVLIEPAPLRLTCTRSFTGFTPGPSRWKWYQITDWIPLKP